MRRYIMVSAVVLSTIGVVMIYSASQVWAEFKFQNEYYYLLRQLLFYTLGIISMIVVSKIDYRNYFKYANHIFFASLVLLIIVLIPGIGMVRGGARSWIGIGQFSLQPSEFMKLGLAIFISKVLAKHTFKTLKDYFGLLMVIVVVFLIIMLQPDFGTGVVIVASMVLVLVISGLPIATLVAVGLSGFLGLVALIISAPYRMKRIFAFIDPWSDPLGSGFQIIQSLYALVPGGLYGFGLGGSRQKYYYLPEPQTDFIFAIVTEELGFIGAGIILMIYLLFFYLIFMTAIKTENLFGSYLSLSIGILLFMQFFINVSVVIGLIPVTGVTLPFLSYGGSSLVLTLVSVGIILNITKDVKL
ncbi:putative lipid II flippase FtsW [Mycoplasmatota bacterium WC44]